MNIPSTVRPTTFHPMTGNLTQMPSSTTITSFPPGRGSTSMVISPPTENLTENMTLCQEALSILSDETATPLGKEWRGRERERGA